MSQTDKVQVRETVQAAAGYQREAVDAMRKPPSGYYELRGPDGELKQSGPFWNLITDVGDEWAIENAHGIAGAGGALTGMRLGTGTTAPAKNGAGAAIVTYVSGSAQAFDTGPTGADEGAGAGYSASYSVTWAAGEATANGIAECVITNEAGPTNVAGSAANTIARFLLSPVVNKGASDSLTVTWSHTHNGS